jgi:hypothetical protein
LLLLHAILLVVNLRGFRKWQVRLA